MTILLLFSTTGCCKVSKRSDSVGDLPRSAYSVPTGHEVKSSIWIAASNNVESSAEQSTKCSGTALVKDPPWADHTTSVTCDSISVGCSTANTLAGPTGPSFHQSHDHDRHRHHLLLLRKSHELSNCWIFLGSCDLDLSAKCQVFRASARTKAVWAAVRYSSRRSKIDFPKSIFFKLSATSSSKPPL